jgi:hypothetical protein
MGIYEVVFPNELMLGVGENTQVVQTQLVEGRGPMIDARVEI